MHFIWNLCHFINYSFTKTPSVMFAFDTRVYKPYTTTVFLCTLSSIWIKILRTKKAVLSEHCPSPISYRDNTFSMPQASNYSRVPDLLTLSESNTPDVLQTTDHMSCKQVAYCWAIIIIFTTMCQCMTIHIRKTNASKIWLQKDKCKINV